VLQDLGQLLAQARSLDPFLRDRVRDWALLSGACLPVTSKCSDEICFKPWSEIARVPELVQGARWAKPKSLDRAIEKLFKSYKFDVSRLLDCCRQTLYFESLDSMVVCLQLIAGDTRVRLVRLKNGMDAEHDASTSGGYRDLSLNLKLITDDATRLGVDNHICEVRLVLVEFAMSQVTRTSLRRDLVLCFALTPFEKFTAYLYVSCFLHLIAV
jgi:hypothetical protein